MGCVNRSLIISMTRLGVGGCNIFATVPVDFQCLELGGMKQSFCLESGSLYYSVDICSALYRWRSSEHRSFGWWYRCRKNWILPHIMYASNCVTKWIDDYIVVRWTVRWESLIIFILKLSTLFVYLVYVCWAGEAFSVLWWILYYLARVTEASSSLQGYTVSKSYCCRLLEYIISPSTWCTLSKITFACWFFIIFGAGLMWKSLMKV